MQEAVLAITKGVCHVDLVEELELLELAGFSSHFCTWKQTLRLGRGMSHALKLLAPGVHGAKLATTKDAALVDQLLFGLTDQIWVCLGRRCSISNRRPLTVGPLQREGIEGINEAPCTQVREVFICL